MKFILQENEITKATQKLLNNLEEKINKLLTKEEYKKEFPIYIAGGGAMSHYVNERGTMDLDVECAPFILRFVDEDIAVKLKELVDENNKTLDLNIDLNYNSSLGLLHEDYIDRMIELEHYQSKIEKGFKFKPYLFHPLDLAISKLSRYSIVDKNDINKLFKNNFFTKEEFELKANEAINYYIGNQNFIRQNLKEALEAFNNIEKIKINEIDNNKPKKKFKP